MAGSGMLRYGCLLLVVALTWSHSHAVITCNATAFKDGTAHITCHFGSNVSNDTHEAFSVVHHSNNSKNGQNPVLECIFKPDPGQPLHCDVDRGYEFNHNVKDHIILNIPNATAVHSGIYSCELIPLGTTTIEPCNLVMQVEKEKILTSTIQPTSAQRTTENSTRDDFPLPEQGKEKESNGVLALVIILLVVSAVSIFINVKMSLYLKRMELVTPRYRWIPWLRNKSRPPQPPVTSETDLAGGAISSEERLLTPAATDEENVAVNGNRGSRYDVVINLSDFPDDDSQANEIAD